MNLSQDSMCVNIKLRLFYCKAGQLVLVLGIWGFVLVYPTENLLPHTCIRLPLARRVYVLYVAQSVLQNRPVSGWWQTLLLGRHLDTVVS